MEIIYKKLIRDNIPEIIAAQGKTPIIRALSDGEYLNALNDKLREEVSEYLEDCCLAELCDILEVAFAIAGAKGYTGKDIEDCRRAKNLKNGAFEKKLFLEKVSDPEATGDPEGAVVMMSNDKSIGEDEIMLAINRVNVSQ